MNNNKLSINDKNKINYIIDKWKKYGFPYVFNFLDNKTLFNRLKDTTKNNFKLLQKYIFYDPYSLDREKFTIPKNLN